MSLNLGVKSIDFSPVINLSFLPQLFPFPLSLNSMRDLHFSFPLHFLDARIIFSILVDPESWRLGLLVSVLAFRNPPCLSDTPSIHPLTNVEASLSMTLILAFSLFLHSVLTLEFTLPSGFFERDQQLSESWSENPHLSIYEL